MAAQAESAASLNTPRFNPEDSRPFQETWYLKVVEPTSSRAFFLEFQLHRSSNRFKQTAEVRAIVCQRISSREVSKVGLSQRHDLQSFEFADGKEIRIGKSSSISSEHTQGTVHSKGQTIEWDLKFKRSAETENTYFNFLPGFLNGFFSSGRSALTPGVDLRVTGIIRINGQTVELREAPGIQGHASGSKNPRAWAWAQCNAFVNERGNPVTFAFEAIRVRNRALGFLPTPGYTSFFVFHEGNSYEVNSIQAGLSLKSRNSLTEWDFAIEKSGLTFRGLLSAEYRDFAGMNIEDTSGAAIYSSLSLLSSLEIRVYRQGRLDSAYYANGTATYGLSSRRPNPYVPNTL